MMIELTCATCIALGLYLKKPIIGLKIKSTKKNSNKAQTKKEPKISETREVLELLILSISSGMNIPNSIKTIEGNSDVPLAKLLNNAVNQHQLGADLELELKEIGQVNKYWKLITAQLILSWAQGARILENLSELNHFFLDLERSQVLKKVKSAAVKSVIPLGLCFLPAFILVVVVPLIAGLINF